MTKTQNTQSTGTCYLCLTPKAKVVLTETHAGKQPVCKDCR